MVWNELQLENFYLYWSQVKSKVASHNHTAIINFKLIVSVSHYHPNLIFVSPVRANRSGGPYRNRL
jgi:hypothetical protein